MQSTGRRPLVDMALQGGSVTVADQVDRAKVLQRLRLSDAAFRHLTRTAAVTVLVILVESSFRWCTARGRPCERSA